MTTVQVRELSFSYPKAAFQKADQESENFQLILDRITFEVSKGEILGILGPNGGGKSTLLKILAGLLKPTSGSLTYHLEDKNRGIIYIPQKDQRNLSYPITILEFLESARLPGSKIPKSECIHALERVELKRPVNQPMSGLSGGEFQRVLLAKAFLQKSQLILMDEPTKGLDGIGQDKLLELLGEFKKNAAVILVDHNIAQVLKHCDRLLCLNKSFHWHDHKSQLKKNILEDTYHCEFEHLLIHENTDDILNHDHHKCSHHDDIHEHKNKHEQDPVDQDTKRADQE